MYAGKTTIIATPMTQYVQIAIERGYVAKHSSPHYSGILLLSNQPGAQFPQRGSAFFLRSDQTNRTGLHGSPHFQHLSIATILLRGHSLSFLSKLIARATVTSDAQNPTATISCAMNPPFSCGAIQESTEHSHRTPFSCGQVRSNFQLRITFFMPLVVLRHRFDKDPAAPSGTFLASGNLAKLQKDRRILRTQ